jgi:hypothetical protein
MKMLFGLFDSAHTFNYGVSYMQWLKAQLVEHSLSVMKDPGSNLGVDICSLRCGFGSN